MNTSPKKIGILAIVLLIFLSAIADVISFIPFAGNIVGPIFWVGVAVFLWLKGFGWFNFRRFVPIVLSAVAEFIPAVQALPTIVAGTIALIFIIKIQEKTGLSLQTLSSGKVNLGKAKDGVDRFGRPSTFNQDGVRMPPQKEKDTGDSRNSNFRPLVVDGIRAPQS